MRTTLPAARTRLSVLLCSLLLAGAGACETSSDGATADPDSSGPDSTSPGPDGAATPPEATPAKLPTSGDDAAYADFHNALGTVAAIRLRGRMVRDDLPLDLADIEPFEMLSQDEMKDTPITFEVHATASTRLEIGGATTDDEGYVDALVELPAGDGALAPGLWSVDVIHGGKVAGTVTARLLPVDYDGITVRSDIDLTWLFTDFTSATGMLELLATDGQDRESLPAMPEVYAALRAGADTVVADRPLSFLSGSPRFFKRIVWSRAALDGVAQDGITLKPFKELVRLNLVTDPLQIVPSLQEQVGYKLYNLLALRVDVPPDTREILMGDDSEADFVIYNLYQRLVSGELDTAALLTELDALNISEGWRTLVAEAAPAVEAHLAMSTAQTHVLAIYVNLTGSDHSSFDTAEWAVPGLTRYHVGAWPLILDQYEEGLVDGAQAGAVRDRLLALGQSQQDLDDAAAAGVAQGFLDAATAADFD